MDFDTPPEKINEVTDENRKEEVETSTEELSDILRQFSNKRDFVKIGDENKQLFIGEVKDAGEFIEVEVILGCDRLALVYMMNEINEKTNKKVKAVFGDGKEMIIEMEDPDKNTEDIEETSEDKEVEKINELRCQFLELQEEKIKCHSDKEEIMMNIDDLKKELKSETDKGERMQMQEQIIKLYENYEMLVEKEIDIDHKISTVSFQEQQGRQRQVRVMEKE